MFDEEKFGVFIHHRRSHRELAGMVYTYFSRKGFKPFWDIQSLSQGDFPEAINHAISNAPYFLCILTKDALNSMNPSNPHDIYYKELELAFQSGCEILVIADDDFAFPKELPLRVSGIKNKQLRRIRSDLSNFFYEMELLSSKMSLDELKHKDVIDWKEYVTLNQNSLVTSRANMETNIVTLSDQYGADFIQSVKRNLPFEGQQRVSSVRMACSAANMIFLPYRTIIDQGTYVYDREMISRVYRTLLQDKDFSFEVITNAPFSIATKDQIDNEKFGSRTPQTRADDPEIAFLGTYGRVYDLITSDSVYKQAWADRRFSYFVTEAVMPFSILHVKYKPEWEGFNHIKIDLYSMGIPTTASRRTMVFFEKDNKDNYDFFVNHYDALWNKSTATPSKHNEWLSLWEEHRGRYC